MWLAEDEGSSACVDHYHSTMIVVELSCVAERNYVYYILERDSAVSGLRNDDPPYGTGSEILPLSDLDFVEPRENGRSIWE